MSLLKTWIENSYLNEEGISKLRRSFVSSKPFKHLHISQFLKEDKCVALLKALKTEEFVHKESDLFSLNQTADLEESRNELLKSFYLLVRSKEFAQWMQSITGLAVKASALDLAGSLYRSTDYLLCHDDQLEDRKIAYILYLSKDFEEKDGARFILFNSTRYGPTTVAHAYPPEWNSLLFFEVSPVSFHMVEENKSKKDRYAIGGWLH